MKKHQEVPVLVTAWVDRGIAPLVRALNEFPGLKTNASCQGDLKERQAFVEFQCQEYNDWKRLGTFLFGFYHTLPMPFRLHVSVELKAYNHFSPEWVIGKIWVNPTPRIIAAVSKHITQMSHKKVIVSKGRKTK